jgi:hypothetical protein
VKTRTRGAEDSAGLTNFNDMRWVPGAVNVRFGRIWGW